MQPNWIREANEFVSGLDAEFTADVKKFYHESEGLERAKGALAAVKALEARLHKFIRS